MKYSLAFLFVAVTAILVASILAEDATPITAENLNELLDAREYNELFVGATLNERHTAEPVFIPRNFAALVAEREDSEKKLIKLLNKLQQAQKTRALALARKGRDQRAHEQMPDATMNEARKARVLGEGTSRNNRETLYEFLIRVTLTVKEFNELLSELARNAAQRTHLANIAHQNGCSQSYIYELTHLRIGEELNGEELKVEKLSEYKLGHLKNALQIFLGPNKKYFKTHLVEACICNVALKSWENDDPDYIIAEKIWDTPGYILKVIIDAAAEAGIEVPK